MQVEKSEELKYLLQVYVRATDSKLERSVQDASWKVGRIEVFVACLRSRNDIRQELWLLWIWVDGPKTSRAENHGFSLKSENSRQGQTCNWSCEQRTSKRIRQLKCQTQLRERRLHSLDHRPQKANAFLEKHARSSMTRTRTAKWRDDLVHLLRQVHRTETRRWRKRWRWRKC